MNQEEKMGMWIVLVIFGIILFIGCSIAYGQGLNSSCGTGQSTYWQYLMNKDTRVPASNNYNNNYRQNQVNGPQQYSDY